MSLHTPGHAPEPSLHKPPKYIGPPGHHRGVSTMSHCSSQTLRSAHACVRLGAQTFSRRSRTHHTYFLTHHTEVAVLPVRYFSYYPTISTGIGGFHAPPSF
jgi:hypothetical protein